jgi:hypothetical protein
VADDAANDNDAISAIEQATMMLPLKRCMTLCVHPNNIMKGARNTA